MGNKNKLKKVMYKEVETGPRGGDKQPGHEGGREGSGTRPSGTGTWGGQPKPPSSPPSNPPSSPPSGGQKK